MASAVAVILSHSYPLLLGVGTPEPLVNVFGFALGGAAVRVFFALSGFMILMSFERRRSTLDFLIPYVMSLIRPVAVLAGVYDDNPFHLANGSLWTLHYEVACYL